jgi:hypothetical protein
MLMRLLAASVLALLAACDSSSQNASNSSASQPSSSQQSAAMPNYERPYGGVMPKGSSFSATGQLKCVRDQDAPEAYCDFGVVREGNGNGWVMVYWPDAGNRVIDFQNGRPVGFDQSEADGDAEMTATREGDNNIVFIGESRFEIPDAVIWGG